MLLAHVVPPLPDMLGVNDVESVQVCLYLLAVRRFSQAAGHEGAGPLHDGHVQVRHPGVDSLSSATVRARVQQ